MSAVFAKCPTPGLSISCCSAHRGVAPAGQPGVRAEKQAIGPIISFRSIVSALVVIDSNEAVARRFVCRPAPGTARAFLRQSRRDWAALALGTFVSRDCPRRSSRGAVPLSRSAQIVKTVTAFPWSFLILPTG
jgi:hypothetical protein